MLINRKLIAYMGEICIIFLYTELTLKKQKIIWKRFVLKIFTGRRVILNSKDLH